MGASDSGHWDRVYRSKRPEAVSWYQPSLRLSLDLIERIGIAPTARVLDVGGGASTLVDDLLDRGFDHLTVLDLSSEALAVARERLGARASRVTWMQGDVTTVELPAGRFDLWHDRAVFHFLTAPEARQRYVRQARQALAPGGHAIVATFGPEGPSQCSGLDVVRYDADGLHAEFGGFEKLGQLEERHLTPWGSEQHFVYCYCRSTA